MVMPCDLNGEDSVPIFFYSGNHLRVAYRNLNWKVVVLKRFNTVRFKYFNKTQKSSS